MKIGIYGGAFNPPHLGHMNILKGFYSQLKLDKLIVIPTNVSPHKVNTVLADNKDRLEMCKLAISEACIKAEVSDIEMKRGDKSYTVDTLKELKLLYPNDEFYFLMGEDMFLTVDKWYKPAQIFSMATICAVKRSESGTKKLDDYALKLKTDFDMLKYKIIDLPYVKASSTEIRNGDFKSLPKSVANYIQEKNLYM